MEFNSNYFSEIANFYFSEAKYDEAEKYYNLAQEKLGTALFTTNIWLCKRRKLQRTSSFDDSFLKSITAPIFAEREEYSSYELKKQLSETQSLLEKYYKEALDSKAQLEELLQK